MIADATYKPSGTCVPVITLMLYGGRACFHLEMTARPECTETPGLAKLETDIDGSPFLEAVACVRTFSSRTLILDKAKEILDYAKNTLKGKYGDALDKAFDDFKESMTRTSGE